MIFLTVGSQKFPFDRLLREVDELVERGVITESVFAQVGHTDYIPKNYEYECFLNREQFNEYIKDCDIVITHGGTGVITKALKEGKLVIAMGRQQQYGEHIDNHQKELLHKFEEEQLICNCKEVSDLEAGYKQIRSMEFRDYIANANTAAYIKDIDEYIKGLEKPERKIGINDKIHKYLEYAITKIKIATKQKVFSYEDTSIRYINEINNSDSLVIVFSACTRIGVKARYNYVKTLSTIKTDKLFILDDYGLDSRGVYYLGKSMDFFVERAVKELIEKVIRKGRYNRIFCVGSSKGGYGALIFGLTIPDSIIVVGAPQYYLGDYFTDKSNKLEKTLSYVIGKTDDDDYNHKINILNNHLKNKIFRIADESGKPKLYIHYSDKEHTYEEHIEGLLKDIEACDIPCVQDVKSYTNHSDVSYYFPEFLLTTLRKYRL